MAAWLLLLMTTHRFQTHQPLPRRYDGKTSASERNGVVERWRTNARSILNAVTFTLSSNFERRGS